MNPWIMRRIKTKQQQQQQPQIVEDYGNDEDILTPPLQEEAPYIVDDTLSIDRAISNVSISNVAYIKLFNTR